MQSADMASYLIFMQHTHICSGSWDGAFLLQINNESFFGGTFL